MSGGEAVGGGPPPPTNAGSPSSPPPSMSARPVWTGSVGGSGSSNCSGGASLPPRTWPSGGGGPGRGGGAGRGGNGRRATGGGRGGGGSIGSHLVDRLVRERPGRIVVVDNLFLGRPENLDGARKAMGDRLKLYIRDASISSVMEQIITEEQVHVVYDLATIPLPASYG